MEDREKYIIDDDEDEENDNAQSDLVKMILSLAFLTEDKAANFSFSKESYGAHMKGVLGNAMKSFSINKVQWANLILHEIILLSFHFKL